MTISVVIPSYNGSRFVESAIKSVLNQTRPADEIIISDDNSKDNTLEICSQFGDKIKIYRNENGPSGFVNGWNNAIAHATGEYISILHQDDLLAPDFLENISNAIQLHPDVKHLFAPCNYINEYGQVIRTPDSYCNGGIIRYSGIEYANVYERIKNHIHRCPGVVTHKSIFDRCKYRTEAGHIADDDFFLRVGNYTDVVGILKPLASYREHQFSETGHLDLLTLNTRLLKDYHFQLEHTAENPMLSDEIIETFCRWETEYIHRLCVFGLKSRHFKFVRIALNHWFKFKKGHRFGNFLYDLKSLKGRFKTALKKQFINSLQAKANAQTEIDFNSKDIVIIAPHPDDEVFGCGGLIARLIAECHAPHVIVLTGGGGSHRGCCSTSESYIISARRKLTHKAMSALGLPESHIHELDFTDGHIGEGNSEEKKKLESLISEINPDVILVPHHGEGWPDHLAARDFGIELTGENTKVYEYCVWMWYYRQKNLDWNNAYVLKMSKAEHQKKLEAIKTYHSALAPCGKPWVGVLPKLFVEANSTKLELFFKIK